MGDSKQYLLTWGYNEEHVDRQSNNPQEEHNHHRQTSTRTQRFPLVITFHSRLPEITNILLHVLHTSDRLKDVVADSPVVAFRRPKNLKGLATSSCRIEITQT